MAMGIWLPGGGGGASSDDCTLMRAAVPKGLTAVTADSDDEALEGTLDTETTLSDSQALSGQTFLKWNPQTKLFERHTGNMANKGAWNSRIGINEKIIIPAGYHNGSGYVDQDLTTKGAATYMPGRSNQVIGSNQWLSGAQTILGDPNLKPENIKKGVPIFGNMGTHEGYVTSPLNIFNNGTWGGGVSGITGLHGDPNLMGTYIDVGIGRKNSNIRRTCNLRLNSAVNLSSYSYLKVDVTFEKGTTISDVKHTVGVSTNAGLQLSASEPLSTVGGIVAYGSVANDGTVIVDVRNLSGNYFIYLDSWQSNTTGTTIKVPKIYLTNN